jgi:hypothetical protein
VGDHRGGASGARLFLAMFVAEHGAHAEGLGAKDIRLDPIAHEQRLGRGDVHSAEGVLIDTGVRLSPAHFRGVDDGFEHGRETDPGEVRGEERWPRRGIGDDGKLETPVPERLKTARAVGSGAETGDIAAREEVSDGFRHGPGEGDVLFGKKADRLSGDVRLAQATLVSLAARRAEEALSERGGHGLGLEGGEGRPLTQQANEVVADGGIHGVEPEEGIAEVEQDGADRHEVSITMVSAVSMLGGDAGLSAPAQRLQPDAGGSDPVGERAEGRARPQPGA